MIQPAVSPDVLLSPSAIAYRGEVVSCVADPSTQGEAAVVHHSDGVLIVDGGTIKAVGDAAQLLAGFSGPVVDWRGRLLMPGFVDTHIHYPQTDVIASFGEQLLTWLERYTFPAEAAFADPVHAAEGARFFFDEMLAQGTTTALIFGTVHPQSVDAVMAEAQGRNLRMIAGKVLMDRHCPEFLRDTPQRGYDESKALIERWHGQGRLGYAVTPRFAPTSTDAQLAACGALMQEFPGVHLQSHVAENKDEIAWARALFPQARSYLDVYRMFGLLGPTSVYAHCIHLDADDRAMMADHDAVMSFCPTSNLFLGSGLFSAELARAAGVRVGLATDVGGGTSFSMWRTLDEAYKVLQMRGETLSAFQALYLATLGGARALGLDDKIGALAPGYEADFIVVDPRCTPLVHRRLSRAKDLAEFVFALMILADDRAIEATYIAGKLSHQREQREEMHKNSVSVGTKSASA